MKNIKWQYSGDVNMLYYGGKNMRCIGNRRFQIVELINMDEACGRDNKGQPKYNVELKLVDLNAVISAENIQSALRFCGMDEAGLADEVLAECCDSYGCHAPLETFNGNNAHQLLRAAYRSADLLADESALESALEKPVNKIGSTAREFMAGDLASAMQRGCESGDTTARIMAKMQGIPQAAINDVRPDDYLPFIFGYMAGHSNQPKDANPDTVAEYFRGYERGQNVRAGKCPSAPWIQQTDLPVA